MLVFNILLPQHSIIRRKIPDSYSTFMGTRQFTSNSPPLLALSPLAKTCPLSAMNFPPFTVAVPTACPPHSQKPLDITAIALSAAINVPPSIVVSFQFQMVEPLLQVLLNVPPFISNIPPSSFLTALYPAAVNDPPLMIKRGFSSLVPSTNPLLSFILL